jgi:hypothetical protein
MGVVYCTCLAMTLVRITIVHSHREQVVGFDAASDRNPDSNHQHAKRSLKTTSSISSAKVARPCVQYALCTTVSTMRATQLEISKLETDIKVERAW